jgi:transposase
MSSCRTRRSRIDGGGGRSHAFKAEVVELCRKGDRSIGEVARDLDLTEASVRRWVEQVEIDKGRRQGLTSDEREELARLRRENPVLREERDILKRATAFFASYSDVGITRVMPRWGLCRPSGSVELKIAPVGRHNRVARRDVKLSCIRPADRCFEFSDCRRTLDSPQGGPPGLCRPHRADPSSGKPPARHNHGLGITPVIPMSE